MRVLRFWVGAVAIAAVVPLAGCDHVPDAVNPVAWYQDATGSSKNQAADANQPNQQNLAAGSKQPYPNLATVPNVPSGATSTVDRKKLVDSLIADRRNAQYNGERLEAGSQLASLAPPPPPAAAAPARGASATTALNPPGAAAPSTSSPPPAQAGAAAPAKSAAASRGHEAPPVESALTSPTIPNVPKGQMPPPPPAPAQVTRTAPPAAPVVAPTNLSPPPSRSASAPPPSPPPSPAGVRAGGSPSLAMRTPAKASNPVSVSVGDIAFAQGSSNLAETQRSALAEIAGLYKRTGGQIRIVGHSEPGSGGDAARQRIAALDLALDRADAVAQALARLGVPARDMQVEAAPATASEQPRAEVFMEY